jgi:mannitol-1-/sugar-/sorbitol-6-/2-deoxyglucose-6-phosphatase
VILRATLFDMDGLLIDSEVLWHEAELEIFGSLGVPIAQRDTRSTKGMYVAEVVDYWHARFPWTGPGHDQVVAMLLERVGELVEENGRLLPGALRAIDLASERGPVALASSTPLALIYRCLDHFTLRERFAAVHSAEFEDYGKPHPGVFLTAAAALDVAAPACLVFEDSAAGVVAAKSGRMTVVAVPVPEDVAEAAFSLADLVLGSLEELEPAWLDERFGR